MADTAHKLTGILRAAAGKKDPKHFTSAVIAAGGASTRMDGNINKLLLDLDGIPVIARTLLSYQSAECIKEIVISASDELAPEIRSICEKYEITKLSKIVSGGETRADSVRNGLEAIDPKADYIAVGDGARCLTTPEIIDKICHEAYLHECAIAAMHAQDTVKIGDKNAFIESTPERKHVWYAQTPQVFKVTVFRAAAQVGADEKIKSTDDSQLVEHIGYPVKLIDCGPENLKITTRFDLICAKAILDARKLDLEEKRDREDGRYEDRSGV